MNDNIKVKTFLSELRRFLPEKTIYLALSSLPEDVFDNEEYLNIPSFENDEEISEFIRNKGFEDPEKLMNFFMEQYFERLEDMMNAMFSDMVKREEQITCDYSYDFEYMSVYG
ncbi:MAG: hypothetical protein J6Y64_08270 [Ruminococcus sp.]|nr:hypothetical protein [Ruminococcus sp.]